MMHLAFSADEKFVPHMGVAMTSILLNASDEDEFSFHVISDRISERSRQKIRSLREIKGFEIEIVDLDDTILQRIHDVKSLALNSFLTEPATYFRLLIGSMFPDLEKILYLDSDIVVLGSIRSLWETDLSSHSIAVVEEPHQPFPPDAALGIPHYFNSGVMLFNLARWRAMGYEGRCFDVEDSILEKIQYADQSILNHVFRGGDLVHLGNQYNYLVCLEGYIREEDFCGSLSEPVIIHYAGLKPWDFSLDIFSQNAPHPRFFSYYWEYRDITPWGKEPFQGAIRWKDIFRYVARHPKKIRFVVKTVNEWKKGIYRR